jgi:uncharacterized protein (DUF1330 family)
MLANDIVEFWLHLANHVGNRESFAAVVSASTGYRGREPREPTMPDQPVFMLANLIIQDAAEYRKYEKGFFPLLKRHGGEFVTFDDAPDTFEGVAPRPGRVILFSFPTEQQARAWFADPDYQALSEYRRAGTQLEFLTMVRGMPPR